jgi:signal transduction histidine kinase
MRPQDRPDPQAATKGLAVVPSSKTDALIRLAAGVSHDLNNIFMVIGGNLSMLKEIWPVPNEAKDILVETLLSVKHGIALSKNMQSYAGRQMLHPEFVDLGVLIADTVSLFQATYSNVMRIELLLPDQASIAYVDREKMVSVIAELLKNARDAMAGVVNITLKKCSDHEVEIMTSATPVQNYCCISVSDSGSGMSSDVLANAQDPLFTTKPNATAQTGWGLSTITGFIRQSEGIFFLGPSDLGGARADVYLRLVE